MKELVNYLETLRLNGFLLYDGNCAVYGWGNCGSNYFIKGS